MSFASVWGQLCFWSWLWLNILRNKTASKSGGSSGFVSWLLPGEWCCLVFWWIILIGNLSAFLSVQFPILLFLIYNFPFLTCYHLPWHVMSMPEFLCWNGFIAFEILSVTRCKNESSMWASACCFSASETKLCELASISIRFFPSADWAVVLTVGMLTNAEGEEPQHWRSAGAFLYHQTAGLVLGLDLNGRGVMESRIWQWLWPLR